MTKIVIETDDAMHFGVREVERVGDQWSSGGVDISELLLQCMQNREQSARQAFQFPNPSLRPVRIPGLHVAHAE